MTIKAKEEESFNVIKTAVVRLMNRDGFANANADRYHNDLMDCEEIRLMVKELSRDHQVEEQFISRPADWREYFRERWMPGWWLRRRPIRYERIKVATIYRKVCPHISIGDSQKHVQFMVADPVVDAL